MISTVTTTTVTTIASVALGASLALFTILALLVFLVQKEILSVSSSSRSQALARALNLAIYPLLLSFVFIAVVKIAEVL